MAYLELSKKYIDKYYNGNKKDAIKAKDGIIFDDEKVKNAFSDGWNGFLDMRTITNSIVILLNYKAFWAVYLPFCRRNGVKRKCKDIQTKNA